MPQPSRPSQAEHMARLLLASIPDDIRKSLSQAELNDRLVYAAPLAARVADPALSPRRRMDAKAEALQVMKAAPRAITEQLVAEKVAKAALLGDSPQADALRRQARQILDENPPAPRRAATVRKAKAVPEDELPVVVFDGDGNCIGIVDPDDIQPVAGKRATCPPWMLRLPRGAG